jgi:hypothetical protein
VGKRHLTSENDGRAQDFLLTRSANSRNYKHEYE